jgi:malic enzyme
MTQTTADICIEGAGAAGLAAANFAGDAAYAHWGAIVSEAGVHDSRGKSYNHGDRSPTPRFRKQLVTGRWCQREGR